MTTIGWVLSLFPNLPGMLREGAACSSCLRIVHGRRRPRVYCGRRCRAADRRQLGKRWMGAAARDARRSA